MIFSFILFICWEIYTIWYYFICPRNRWEWKGKEKCFLYSISHKLHYFIVSMINSLRLKCHLYRFSNTIFHFIFRSLYYAFMFSFSSLFMLRESRRNEWDTISWQLREIYLCHIWWILKWLYFVYDKLIAQN